MGLSNGGFSSMEAIEERHEETRTEYFRKISSKLGEKWYRGKWDGLVELERALDNGVAIRVGSLAVVGIEVAEDVLRELGKMDDNKRLGALLLTGESTSLRPGLSRIGSAKRMPELFDAYIHNSVLIGTFVVKNGSHIENSKVEGDTTLDNVRARNNTTITSSHLWDTNLFHATIDTSRGSTFGAEYSGHVSRSDISATRDGQVNIVRNYYP